MKGRILQLALNEEISPDKSTARRSQTTGHLLIEMPKLKYILEGRCSKETREKGITRTLNEKDSIKEVLTKQVERLEVAAEADQKKNRVDYRNIVNDEQSRNSAKNSFIFEGKTPAVVTNVVGDDEEDFIDDPDVPPLE